MDIKGAAIGVLGDIGDARAVEPTLNFLEDDYLVLVAIEALGQIGDKRALKALESMYSKYRDLRIRPAIDKALYRIQKTSDD